MATFQPDDENLKPVCLPKQQVTLSQGTPETTGPAAPEIHLARVHSTTGCTNRLSPEHDQNTGSDTPPHPL